MNGSAWSLAAVRDALLKGREPAPASGIAQLPSYRWLVVGVVSIGAFMGQVDASIAQLLLPSLERTFGATLSAVSWVAVAYLLTMAALMPIFGRLADMLGHKLLYTAGFVVFVVGSGLCGLAPDLPILVAARVLQAIGGALLSANSVAIVVAAAGPEERGRGVGIQAAAQAVGLCAGPVIGGILLSTLGWQWVFWINVPFGIVGAIAGWFILPQTAHLSADEGFDVKGALLLGPMLTAFMIVLNEGHAWGVTSPAIIATAIAGVALLVLFLRAETRVAAPLLDPRLFETRAFALANAGSLMSYALLFGVMLLMPFVFERAYLDDPLAAGLRLSIVPIAISLLAPVSGVLYDRLGPRVPTLSGMAACGAGLVLLYATLRQEPHDLLYVMLALGVFGVGQGLFTAANNTAIMAAAPEDLSGEAGGLLNVTRAFGISLGIAGASTVLAWRLSAMGHAGASTVAVAPATMLAASREVVVFLALFALAAAVASALPTGRGPSLSPRR
jgi:EmrB/QacA subfamily drug resistance transporter